MNFLRLVVCSIAAFLMVAAVPVVADDAETERRPATELAGLWAARRDFGPEISGVLEISSHDRKWTARVAGFEAPVQLAGNRITFEIAGDRGAFRGVLDSQTKAIQGHWIQPPTIAHRVPFASPVELTPVDGNHWRGIVTPLDDTMTFYLLMRRDPDGRVSGVLRNPEVNNGRFFDLQEIVFEGDRLLFLEPDRDSARLFGVYEPDRGEFSMYYPDAGGTFDFIRVDDTSPFYPRPRNAPEYSYRPPAPGNDGWEIATLAEVGMAAGPIEEMIRMIADTPMDSIDAPYLHAVLIARHGKLVLEESFHGYSPRVPHDTRSASKTVSATLVGLAEHAGEPVSPETSVYSTYFGDELPADLDPRAKRMTMKHLLTMTPGLACDDNDDESPGSEWRMQSQTEQPDWVRFFLELPVLYEPGDHVAYCSASPNAATGVLSAATGSWIPDLYQEYFARPMQMGLSHMNLMPNGEAYGGGGLHILGRDFLKLGQIFLESGAWKDRTLLGEDWVEDAVAPSNHMFDQGYGYGWWINSYPYRDGTVTAFYAGGNGGQYVIGIPELDLAIVFFGGNYGQAATHLIKRKHVPDYIIRSVDLGATAKTEQPERSSR